MPSHTCIAECRRRNPLRALKFPAPPTPALSDLPLWQPSNRSWCSLGWHYWLVIYFPPSLQFWLAPSSIESLHIHSNPFSLPRYPHWACACSTELCLVHLYFSHGVDSRSSSRAMIVGLERSERCERDTIRDGRFEAFKDGIDWRKFWDARPLWDNRVTRVAVIADEVNQKMISKISKSLSTTSEPTEWWQWYLFGNYVKCAIHSQGNYCAYNY